MAQLNLSLLLVLLSFSTISVCYPTGAPISACETMMPGHVGIFPQPKPAPYIIKTNSSSMESGRPIQGDSLTYHNGMKFSTYDNDRDVFLQNCASLSAGGFWYRACHLANLNGPYLRGAHLSYGSGVIWSQWRGLYYSLKSTEMKIRRV